MELQSRLGKVSVNKGGVRSSEVSVKREVPLYTVFFFPDSVSIYSLDINYNMLVYMNFHSAGTTLYLKES